MQTLLQDVKYGARMLAKSPGFTIVAVLTLALGIGASTAVFSIVDAVLLKPLPYPHADRIVFPWRQAPAVMDLGYNEVPWGARTFQHFQHDVKTFQDVGAFEAAGFNLTGTDDPVRIDGVRASAGFFRALGVAPLIGRTFLDEEDHPGRDREVILGYGLWQRKFGADRNAVGRTLKLNGASYTVVGVMPSGFAFPRGEEMPGSFQFPRQPEMWVPEITDISPDRTAPDEMAVIARLNPGVTLSESQNELNVFAKEREKEFPGAEGWFSSKVTPLASQVSGETRRPLLLIFGAVGVVLLIACANVANLLLTRSLGRRREFTLRAALGAAQGRLVRQLLTESVLLAFLGGVAGLLLGELAIQFVKAFGPLNIPRLHEIRLDPGVFAFTLVVTLVTGLLFGLAPALGATREDLVDTLKEGGLRSGSGPARQKIRSALLVSEVALALVLVIAAGLLVRTFFHLLKVDPGFNSSRVLIFELTLPGTRYPDKDSLAGVCRKVLDRLSDIPGVQAAGLGSPMPMSGGQESSAFAIPGRNLDKNPDHAPMASYTIASPGYFSAIGTLILRGRPFLDSDTADSQPVAIISKTLADQFYPGEDPIGKSIKLPPDKFPVLTIVGIAADVKHFTVRESTGPEFYVVYTQKPYPDMLTMQVALRTQADPRAIIGSAREAIRSVDPTLPIAKVSTLSTLVDDSMTQPRFSMLLLAAFALLALLLASIGIYGVISYAVAQRTQEFGIRLALGAQPRNVFSMVLGQGARLALLGVALGFIVAFAVTRVMTSLLFGVQPTDPITFIAVPALLMAVALLACYIPARRATRVDPIVALRYE
ncbi:MAG TPA: ABC transporter permease [Candidatus Acidoferrales bacterium]|nr:ABC transporter permease [Candidatus Acidoferrales bacterium]